MLRNKGFYTISFDDSGLEYDCVAGLVFPYVLMDRSAFIVKGWLVQEETQNVENFHLFRETSWLLLKD